MAKNYLVENESHRVAQSSWFIHQINQKCSRRDEIGVAMLQVHFIFLVLVCQAALADFREKTADWAKYCF